MEGTFALVSCYDKSGLEAFATKLIDQGINILSTGGTYAKIASALPDLVGTSRLRTVESLTGFPEILNGRVKTLHPLIHGGLLTDWNNEDHSKDASQHGIPRISVLAVNLYPFWEVTGDTTMETAVELIDIGGVAMLRAGAKNHKHVAVFTDPKQYEDFPSNHKSLDDRRRMALQAFQLTAKYDGMISKYLGAGEDSSTSTIDRAYAMHTEMKYGCNPHQSSGCGLFSIDGRTPALKLLNGAWGYINVLDAIGCWALVKELNAVTGREAACSFKHTSPAGAAVAVPWDEIHPTNQKLLSKLYRLGPESSPALNAYVRSRNADPMSSFGDFIGYSGVVDVELAGFIAKQISDGMVAAGYTPEALEILRGKKSGRYVVVEADPAVDLWGPDGLEVRELGGMALVQPCNKRTITAEDLGPDHVVAQVALAAAAGDDDGDAKQLPANVVLDLLVANACLKYAQSNNVACAFQGQLVGLSAGQQSRVHSAALACSKAGVWTRRHHHAALSALDVFAKGVKAQAKINATTALAEDPSTFLRYHMDVISPEQKDTATKLAQAMKEEENAFKPTLVMASDAFFPFPDSIHVAKAAGVKYVSQPGGSARDEEVTAACVEYQMCMIHTGVRIFTH